MVAQFYIDTATVDQVLNSRFPGYAHAAALLEHLAAQAACTVANLEYLAVLGAVPPPPPGALSFHIG